LITVELNKGEISVEHFESPHKPFIKWASVIILIVMYCFILGSDNMEPYKSGFPVHAVLGQHFTCGQVATTARPTMLSVWSQRSGEGIKSEILSRDVSLRLARWKQGQAGICHYLLILTNPLAGCPVFASSLIELSQFCHSI
jgi:hypothetical protein